MKKILLVAATLIGLSASAQPIFQLDVFANGFVRPVDIAFSPDNAIFVVEQAGYIYMLDSAGNKNSYPFLDIDARVRSVGNEQGLLGMTFHPDYDSNGYFYVHYTDNNSDSRISRFKRQAGDPTRADTNEFNIYTAFQPYSNHNAGDLTFGPDGYLYFGMGDGGSGGDPGNRAQNRLNNLGKMMRVDVDGGSPYAIPSTNPFVGDSSTLDEIWHIGLRNPWRFSFDRTTGDMFIGDVGQNQWEEINYQPASSTGGENWGWRCYEGNNAYNTSGCQPQNTYDAPIFEINHNFGSGAYSITGGYMYRGSQFSDLEGRYICGDYLTGHWWTLWQDSTGAWQNSTHLSVLGSVSTFGEDQNGEIYCAHLTNGNIYHVTEICSPFQLTSSSTDDTCGNFTGGSAMVTPGGGTGPYTYTWSSSDTGAQATDLAGGTYTVTVTDQGTSCARTETFVINIIYPHDVAITASGDSLYVDPSWHTFQWLLNGDTIPGATGPSHLATATGTYTVIVSDPNGVGCEVTSDPYGHVLVRIKVLNEELLDIRPNPSSGDVTVYLDGEYELLRVFDLQGRIIYQTPATRESLVIRRGSLPPGLYLVELVGKTPVRGRMILE